MGKKLKVAVLGLVGVLGLAAFAPAAKADEGRFYGGGDRFEHGERYRDGRDGWRDGWRRERFEHGRWMRDRWGREHFHRWYW